MSYIFTWNKILNDYKKFLDQYQYLGNCPPTPPLTQQQSIDNKLGLKCWVKGGVGGQLPRYWYWSKFFILKKALNTLIDQIQDFPIKLLYVSLYCLGRILLGFLNEDC